MLCDQDWYQKHKDDYTQEEIDALGIEIAVDGHKHLPIKQGANSGRVKELMKLQAGKQK